MTPCVPDAIRKKGFLRGSKKDFILLMFVITLDLIIMTLYDLVTMAEAAKTLPIVEAVPAAVQSPKTFLTGGAIIL